MLFRSIDYIEEVDGMFTVFEMKWNPKKSGTSIPKSFLDSYPVASTAIVTPENYMEYLM